jgi:hypothetical protein
MQNCAFCENQTPLFYQDITMCLECSQARERDIRKVDDALSIKRLKQAESPAAPLPSESDTALYAFLRAELDLALTYAQTKKTAPSQDESRARERAKDAVETIGWFRDRIGDREVHRELQEGAARVEQLLAGD